MAVKRTLLLGLAWLYLAVAALVIYGLPYSKYEWMLDQIASGAQNPYCSLPLDDSGGMLLVTGALIVPIVLGALAYAVAHRRWDALLCGAVAVAGFAVLKWTVFSPFHGC